MKKFTYTITNADGIHARPAALIINEAKNYSSEIAIVVEDKKVPAISVIALMVMGIKCGQSVTVEVNGEDEEEAAVTLENFFKLNL